MATIMSQINCYAPRMHLPIDVPVKDQDIRFLHVSAPIVSGTFQNYGGRIQVKNYSFTFAPNGRRTYNLDEHNFKSFGVPMEAKELPNSGMERASKLKYLLNTNDAYQMATTWIAALEIDLAKLEAANPPHVEQGTFQSKRGSVPSPILSVEWKNPRLLGYDRTAFYVEITAVNGELRSLTDGDGTFSKRKQPLIKDLNELLAI